MTGDRLTYHKHRFSNDGGGVEDEFDPTSSSRAPAPWLKTGAYPSSVPEPYEELRAVSGARVHVADAMPAKLAAICCHPRCLKTHK
eukprot:5657918-Pleurochrysis_carterae.AAC.3